MTFSPPATAWILYYDFFPPDFSALYNASRGTLTRLASVIIIKSDLIAFAVLSFYPVHIAPFFQVVTMGVNEYAVLSNSCGMNGRDKASIEIAQQSGKTDGFRLNFFLRMFSM